MKETAFSRRTRIALVRKKEGCKHIAVSFIRANNKASAEAQRELCSQRAESIGLHITYEFAVIGLDSSHVANL